MTGLGHPSLRSPLPLPPRHPELDSGSDNILSAQSRNHLADQPFILISDRNAIMRPILSAHTMPKASTQPHYAIIFCQCLHDKATRLIISFLSVMSIKRRPIPRVQKTDRRASIPHNGRFSIIPTSSPRIDTADIRTGTDICVPVQSRPPRARRCCQDCHRALHSSHTPCSSRSAPYFPLQLRAIVT